MQFTTIAAALLSVSAAVASPLEARTGYGSCASNCQYTCTTNGVANVLTCVSALNGNTISIPLSAVLKREAMEVEKRNKKKGDKTCCTTNGVLNILTCVNLANGNTVSVPLSVVVGLL